MHIDDFSFELPSELIARFPLRERSGSRLMQVQGDHLTHWRFSDLTALLQPNDLLIFNDTKVIPARLFGQKTTGGKVELLVERLLDDHRILAQLHLSKPPKIGDQLHFPNEIKLEVLGRVNQFYELRSNERILDVIEAIGKVPLPPYMHREATEADTERYQTVYAKYKGSVAAPTAGLHFDEDLLQRIKEKNIKFGYVTLHIGAGTFAPIRVENIREHKMHAEYLEVTDTLCEQIKATKKIGGRIIAVGTTTLRSLESASQSGEIQPYRGDTNIFIYPGYQFHGVDALITNLHLPRSTLMMLVCAFGGQAQLLRAYREAVVQKYRFYSYGDAMWIDYRS